MKIFVKITTGEIIELKNHDLYSDAVTVANLIQIKGVVQCKFLVGKDDKLILPDHVVQVWEES